MCIYVPGSHIISVRILITANKFVLLGPIAKTRWPPQPLIGWDIFDFFSETAERNSTKLDRKQDLNVFYQVCVFWADRKNKMAALASEEKSKMSQPIRGQGSHLVLTISPKNTNLVEGVEILLPVKFSWIPFVARRSAFMGHIWKVFVCAEQESY